MPREFGSTRPPARVKLEAMRVRGAVAASLVSSLPTFLSGCAGDAASSGRLERGRDELEVASRDPTRGGAPEASASLILLDARVRTLDPRQPLAEAVAIGDGRILAVGSSEEMARLRTSGTKVLPLEGAWVVPGLVDAHLHLEWLGQAERQLELRDLGLNEVLEAVERAAKATPRGGVIRGHGWDQNLWHQEDCPGRGCLDQEGFPDRALLDRVAKDHVVVLTRIDGHALWVNSAALRRAGGALSTSDPVGGRIHLRLDGTPSGILIDAAMAAVEERLPRPSPSEVEAALIAAQEHLVALGLTGAHDMGTSPEVLAALRRLDASGRLKLRVHAYHWGNEGDLEALLAAEEGAPIEPKSPAPRLRVLGVKLMVDGALGSRGAALLAPYSDADHAGALLLTPGELEARTRIAVRRGLQVATHAIGDRANRMVLDAYETVWGDGLGSARPRIEHAQVLHPKDLRRLARSGAIPSMQPIHATSDLPWAIERLGTARLEGAYAWRSLLAAGATLAAGSDAPVESADPRLGLRALRARWPREGAPRGMSAEAQTTWLGERLDGEAALRAYTVGPAYAVGEEHRLGRIAPGHLADLTVLSLDPVETPPAALPDIEVRMTVVAGEVVFRGPDRT